MGYLKKFTELSEKKDHLRYVNDYSTELYTDKKGKTKEKVTYIGPVIPFKNDKKEVTMKLVAVALLSVLLIASIVYGAMCEHTTGSWFLTSLPMAVSFFPCLYLAMGTIELPFNAKPMQRDRYMHSIIRVFKSCGALMGIMIAELLFELVYRLIHKDWMFLKGDIVFLVAVFGALVCAVLSILILRSIDTDEREIEEFDRR